MTLQRFTPQQLDEVRARTDLVALVSRTIPLQQRGREHWALCPFHGERTPSFHVRRDKGYFHCFGCGAHGDCFSWMMHAEGWSFPEAVRELGIDAGLWDGRRREAPKRLAPIVALPPKPEEVARTAQATYDRMRALWNLRRPPQGTVVADYWVTARKLGEPIAESIYFLPDAEYRVAKRPPEKGHHVLGRFPVMLAPITFGKKLITLHRTYLLPDGSGKVRLADPYDAEKILSAKKIMGPPGRGAIRLTSVAEEMLLGEGIETSRRAHLYAPEYGAWSGYSLSHIAGRGVGLGEFHPLHPRRRLPSVIPDMSAPGLVLPSEIRRVVLLRDADSKDQHAVDALLQRAAQRLIREGRAAAIASPDDGHDFGSWRLEEAA